MSATLLRQRDVRLIVGAVGISALGDFLIRVPLTLHIQEMTDSGIAVAALFIALWMPVVVLAPVVAGAIPVLAAVVGLALYRRPAAPTEVAPAEPQLTDVGLTTAETSPAAPRIAD